MNRTRRADPRKAEHPVPLRAESRSRPTDDWLAPLNLMNEWQKEGHEKGLQEGVQMGLQEGLRVARRTLIAMLRARFGDIPETVTRHLDTLQDPESVDALVDLAATCATLADFRSGLQEPQ